MPPPRCFFTAPYARSLRIAATVCSPWLLVGLLVSSAQANAQDPEWSDGSTLDAATPLFLLGGLAALLGLGGLAVMWAGKKKQGLGLCANCGRYRPLHPVVFRYNIGMLIARRYAEKGGPFCKGCIHRTFWGYTALLVFVGWWGMISALITPFLFLANVYHYLESLLLPSQPMSGPPGNHP